jgi:hypothetical protein
MLFASEVAAIAGKHPYKPRREALLGVVKRCAPDVYTERKFESAEDLANKVLERSADLKSHIESIKTTTTDASGVSSALKEATAKLATCIPDASPKEAQAAAEKIRSTVFTSLGTNCETHVYDKLPNLLGIEVKKADALLKKQIGVLPRSGIPLWVCGRLDALGEDGTVIEIKNRVRRLFGTVPEYERIQVLTYLFLTGSQDAFLVEAFKDQCATYAIQFSDSEWSDLQNDIMSGIDDFLDAEKI